MYYFNEIPYNVPLKLPSVYATCQALIFTFNSPIRTSLALYRKDVDGGGGGGTQLKLERAVPIYGKNFALPSSCF